VSSGGGGGVCLKKNARHDTFVYPKCVCVTDSHLFLGVKVWNLRNASRVLSGKAWVQGKRAPKTLTVIINNCPFLPALRWHAMSPAGLLGLSYSD
jgi:hypothetical protein